MRHLWFGLLNIESSAELRRVYKVVNVSRRAVCAGSANSSQLDILAALWSYTRR